MDESKQTGSRMAAEGSGSASMACGAVHRQTPKAGARCVNSARRDLCGGYPVTGIPTATLKGVQIMPRISDIQAAFIAAIELNPKGYRYLRTDSFIEKLRGFNWHFTRADANAWIERNQPGFADKTTDGSDNRYWILRNMGRVH